MFTVEQFNTLTSIDQIATLHPKDFEWFTKFFLEKKGHSSVWVRGSHNTSHGDGGVDVESIVNSQKVYTQCKRWHPNFRRTFKGYLPVAVIRELGGCMWRDKVGQGIIVTTLNFESRDKAEATKMNIELIGRNEIVEFMQVINPGFGKRTRLTFLAVLFRLIKAIFWFFLE